MALPKDITQIMGVRDTADASSLSIDPKQPFAIGQEIYRFNPNKHQLLSWAMTHSRRKPCETHAFFHLEKAPLPNWVKYTGADESSQATTGLTFENGGTRLTTASRVYVARTGEVIRLTADMSGNDTAAVVRNFGTSGTPLLKNGDKCKILPPAHMEGRTMGEGPTGGEVVKSFATSIVDWPVQLTGTKAAERNVDGSSFENALDDALEQSQDQLESELLFGAYKIDDSSYTYPLHTTNGLMNFISTNVWSVNGYMTRMDFWDIIAEWRKFNKEGGAIVCSSEMISMINEWVFHKLTFNQDMKTLGMDIQQIRTPSGGLFDLIECDLLGQEKNLMGTILLLPGLASKQGIDYRPLIAVENRDIKYQPVNEPEKDLKQGCIFGEYAWEFWGEERFGVVTGIDF